MHTEITQLLQTKGTSENSIKQYLRCLTILNDDKHFKTLSFLKKKDDINKKLDTYKATTKRNFYTAIVTILKLYDNKYKSLVNHYYKLMMTKVETEKKNYVNFETLKNIFIEFYKNLKKQIKTSTYSESHFKIKLEDLLLSSFYIFLEPRRSEYLFMKLSTNSIYPDINANYIDIKQKKLIFNNYKTKSTYGQQIINIPDELMKVIKLYLKYIKLNNGDNIFDFKTKTDITKALNRVFGEGVSSSHIRHSYLKFKYGDINEERKATAEKMGHSVGMQNQYIEDVNFII